MTAFHLIPMPLSKELKIFGNRKKIRCDYKKKQNYGNSIQKIK
jgi:hypothetical protein